MRGQKGLAGGSAPRPTSFAGGSIRPPDPPDAFTYAPQFFGLRRLAGGLRPPDPPDAFTYGAWTKINKFKQQIHEKTRSARFFMDFLISFEFVLIKKLFSTFSGIAAIPTFPSRRQKHNEHKISYNYQCNQA